MNTRFLNHLAKDYPNIQAASAEIINLNAILALPKGTEYFFSDLHGEHEAFVHMMKSASGVIYSKIEEIFGPDLTRKEREALSHLIYNVDAELKRRKESEEDFNRWCIHAIWQLTEVCREVTSKYTRSKVRRRLPKYLAYSMDELLHADDVENKSQYYSAIIKSIVDCGVAEEFIREMAHMISNLAVDRLHIIGDIWDRGAHPDKIMDFLMTHHDVDFQWGNHDIVWMGAATGNMSCITNVLRMNIAYNNFDMIEVGYGINLRPLAMLASTAYADDPCEFFKPKILEENIYAPVDKELAAKMNKAIAVCQFKIEGQTIMEHPEYKMEHRMMLDKIDYEKGTITIKGETHELRDSNFPTIDPADPYKLTPEEEETLEALKASFMRSEKLQRHINFIFTHGALYKVVNGNLLFHGCIPMTEYGTFAECTVNGVTKKGKDYMDYLDDQVRKAYYAPDESEETGHRGDIMWYLWLSGNSPLFGKDQMTTFERCFIADKKTHKEHTMPYYKLIDNKEVCEMILEEFGLNPKTSHILNGHVPVKIKDGESPVRAGGRRIVIDGGISKAYQKTTGIAGYTFIFNSWTMALAEHRPYEPMKEDGTQTFYTPKITTVETLPKRMMVRDSDQGRDLEQQVEDLKELVAAYRSGKLKEVF